MTSDKEGLPKVMAEAMMFSAPTIYIDECYNVDYMENGVNGFGVKEVLIAGMDGYTEEHINDYFDKNMKLEHFSEAKIRNKLMGEELNDLRNFIKIKFLTPTKY